MPWKSFEEDGKFCVYKLNESGEKTGKSLGCHDSKSASNKQVAALYASEKDVKKAIELFENPEEAAKYGYYEDSYTYVPFGVSSLADAIASEEARKEAGDIRKLASMFEQVVSNILSDSEIDNKKSALASLADELRDLVTEEVDDIYASKSVDDLKAKRKGSPKASDYLVVEDASDSGTWHLPVKENDVANHRLMGAAWASLHSGYRGNKYAGPDREKALSKLKRLYKKEGLELPTKKSFEEDEFTAIKSLSDKRVGGYAVLWGNAEAKDLTGEYFTSDTEELTTIFEAVGKLPFIYHHTLNETLKSRVIGLVDTMKLDSVGLWYEAELKLSDEYDQAVAKLIKEGRLKTSTQTFGVARKATDDGHITRWPIVEISATPTPAEPRMLAIGEVKGVFAEIGFDVTDVMKDYEEDVPDEVDNAETDQGAEKARLRGALELERALLLSI